MAMAKLLDPTHLRETERRAIGIENPESAGFKRAATQEEFCRDDLWTDGRGGLWYRPGDDNGDGEAT